MVVRGSGFHKRRNPGGGAASFSYSVPASGVSTNTSASTISVPSGAAAGDMLVLSITNGGGTAGAMPTGFTSVYNGGASGSYGGVGYRVMQAGDSSFSLASTDYVTMVALRRSTGVPTLDQNTINTYTAGGTLANASATPSTATDAALMIFLSSDNVMSNPAPGFTNLITYNLTGAGTSGMAISWTQLASASAFTGTTCGGSANSSFPAAAILLLFK
jgi:hypothetical protein